MKWIAPQLATLYPDAFSDSAWIFEEKFDGIRCIAVKSKGKVILYSRNHQKMNQDFLSICKALERIHIDDCIFDGEIVAFENKVTSFRKLQKRKQQPVAVSFYIFDLLVLNGKNITSMPLVTRKKLLKNIPLKKPLHYTPHVEGNGNALFAKAQKNGWEGIIAKKKDAPYVSKRTRNFLKCKCMQRQEFVIGGFTKPQKSRVGFGALLIGYFEKGMLRFCGKVGTGYDKKMLLSLRRNMERLIVKKCPFTPSFLMKDAHFISPKLVCEIHFTEWTDEKKLRHPSFVGLRFDKKAINVHREIPCK